MKLAKTLKKMLTLKQFIAHLVVVPETGVTRWVTHRPRKPDTETKGPGDLDQVFKSLGFPPRPIE